MNLPSKYYSKFVTVKKEKIDAVTAKSFPYMETRNGYYVQPTISLSLALSTIALQQKTICKCNFFVLRPLL